MEAPRGVELTSTNSPCVLFSCNFLPSLVIIFDKISLVVMEERVHPTPFRTRQLSSPSPMILHNVMWESRPPPKIVRKAPAAVRAGAFSFFFSSFLLPSYLPILRLSASQLSLACGFGPALGLGRLRGGAAGGRGLAAPSPPHPLPRLEPVIRDGDRVPSGVPCLPR